MPNQTARDHCFSFPPFVVDPWPDEEDVKGFWGLPAFSVVAI
jgi:hypothetical protein